jgi:hypothetical protein
MFNVTQSNFVLKLCGGTVAHGLKIFKSGRKTETKDIAATPKFNQNVNSKLIIYGFNLINISVSPLLAAGDG